jgi:hypothetical protein
MTNQGKQHFDDVQSETKKKLHWLEIGYFSSQIILAAIGIWALTIYHGQLAAMQGQLNEMKHTNDLTQQALNSNGETLRQTLAKMQGQVDATNTLAGHTKDQADKAAVLAANSGIQAKASQEFADAAKRNADIAKDTLQATIDSFHNEDRAWVGIAGVKPFSLTPDGPNHSVNMVVAFTLRNYGRSAAEHVHFLADLESDPTVFSLSCDEVAAKNHAGDVLLPTQERTLNWVMNLTSDQMRNGWTHQNPKLGNELILRIIGCIEYTDREGEMPPHRTPFTYMVIRRGGFITPDSSIPGEELSLEPFGTESNQTR